MEEDSEERSFGERFGNLIRQKRAEKGLSQEALAALALSNSDRKGFISKIEKGKVRNPQVGTIKNLARALEIDESEIRMCRYGVDFPEKYKLLSDFKDSSKELEAKIGLAQALFARSIYKNNVDDIRSAIEEYRTVVDIMRRNQEVNRWVEVKNALGCALMALYDEVGEISHLDEAIDIFKSLLPFINKRKDVDIWSGIQNNLGMALKRYAEKMGDLDALDESIIAFREAINTENES